MSGTPAVYRPDLSLKGKLRRRLVRVQHRRPAPRGPGAPWVTFSFDDAPESAFATGLPILEAHAIPATIFACMGLAGTVTSLGRLMDAAQLREAAVRGHEIGCHTFSHRDLGQASAAEAAGELDANRQAFAKADLPAPRAFAYPYGDVCAAAKAVCGARFDVSRALHPGRVTAGADLAQAPATTTDGPEGEVRALAALARAAAEGGWLFLYGHRVDATPGEFSTDPGALERLAAAARRLGIEPVTAREGARRLLAVG